jgi:hypothetical protein
MTDSLSHYRDKNYYLQKDYPLWVQEIADRPYPQVMHEILAIDAYLIYQTAYVLNRFMQLILI